MGVSQLLKLCLPGQEGTTSWLDSPQEYSRQHYYVSREIDIADGSFAVEYTAGPKNLWVLKWTGAGSALKARIEQVVYAQGSAFSHSRFRDQDGTWYNVIAKPDISEGAPAGRNPIEWDIALTLREV